MCAHMERMGGHVFFNASEIEKKKKNVRRNNSSHNLSHLPVLPPAGEARAR